MQDFKTGGENDARRVFGSASDLAGKREWTRRVPAVTLWGTVIGSCHTVFNSPFFKASENDGGRRCEASFTHQTCQTGVSLFQHLVPL